MTNSILKYNNILQASTRPDVIQGSRPIPNRLGGRGDSPPVCRPTGNPVSQAGYQSTFTDLDQGKTLLYPDTGHSIIISKVTPGYSEAKADCGTTKYHATCSSDQYHHSKPVRHHCKRAACPICWTTWADRETKSLTELIEGYESASRTSYHARHVSLSPSAEQIKSAGHTKPTPEALTWLYDTANDLLDELGITATAVIAHPYRIKPEYKRIVNDQASDSGMNRYTWALSQDNWYDYVYFSPHLHLLCFGKLMCSELFEAKTGWIYRNHKSRSGEDLPKTIRYLLSHAWVQGNSKVVRCWRGMSTRNLGSVLISRICQPVLCPVCGSPLVQVYPTHPDQELKFCEPVLEWIEIRGYYIRGRKSRKTK
jgi:hypothetical protein